MSLSDRVLFLILAPGAPGAAGAPGGAPGGAEMRSEVSDRLTWEKKQDLVFRREGQK